MTGQALKQTPKQVLKQTRSTNPSRPPIAVEGSSESSGTRKLREYLAAPEPIRAAFDRRIAAAIDRDLEYDRSLDAMRREEWYAATAEERAVFRVPVRSMQNRRRIAEALGLPTHPIMLGDFRWDESWRRRSLRPQPRPGEYRYDRDSDPLLLDVNLRDAWEQVTGEPLRGALASCPHPDHEDRFPSCAVRDRLFFCNGCDAKGSIIDLGGYVYGLTPRGRDFHRIREQLLADLGLVDRKAAA